MEAELKSRMRGSVGRSRNWCRPSSVSLVKLALLAIVMLLVTSSSAQNAAIQQELLKFLGIKRPHTNVNNQGKVNNYMQRVYKDQQLFDMGTESSNRDRLRVHRPYPTPPDTVRSIANVTEIGKNYHTYI